MKVAQALVHWLDEIILKLGTRTIPIIAMDLNDEYGSRRDLTGQHVTMEDKISGCAEPRQEHGHTNLMRTWMEQHHCCCITSFFNTGMTYHGEKSSSKIDHFVIPQGLRLHVTKHITLTKAMRRLQLISTQRPKDHKPLLLEFEACTRHAQQQPGEERTPPLDRDHLMDCLTKGKKEKHW